MTGFEGLAYEKSPLHRWRWRGLSATFEVAIVCQRWGEEMRSIFASISFRASSLLIFLGGLSYFIVTNYSLPVRSEVAPALLGTFWGFLLSQLGILLYDRRRGKQELIFMFASARTELTMHKDTLGWIKQLKDQQARQRDIHGLGFAGTDSISYKVAENLVSSPLIYEFASRVFSPEQLLSIYQTLRVIEREVPTNGVGDDDYFVKHGHIKFEKTIDAIDALLRLIDSEGRRLAGHRKWNELTVESTSEPGVTGLFDWKWIGIGVVLMIVLYLIAGFALEFGAGLKELSGGRKVLAGMGVALAFSIGGFIVGVRSAGRTTVDPWISAAIAVVIVVLISGDFNIGNIIVLFLAGVLGGWLGERWQDAV
jgi:hypothetical protein